MTKQKAVLRVPFDMNTHEHRNDGLMSYVESYQQNKIEWRDNYTFNAVLQLECFERGRSAAHAIWRDTSTNYRYPMFLTFLEEALLHHVVNHGIVLGTFTFAKRGANYSIRMVFDGG